MLGRRLDLLFHVDSGVENIAWDEITYPFLYFNGCFVEVWEFVNYSTATLYQACDYFSILESKLIPVNPSPPSAAYMRH